MMSIDWVHPSVRDVAIDYLMGHDAERRRFLQTASPAGIVMALSSAGGSAGERSMPLLRDSRDWTCLESRVRKLMSVEATKGQLALMRGLLPPLLDLTPLDPTVRDRLTTLAAAALEVAIESWDRSGEVLSRQALGSFFELSSAGGRASGSPRLSRTWASWCRGAVDADWSDAAEAEVVVEWLKVIGLLVANVPGFRRYLDWMDICRSIASQGIQQLRNRCAELPDVDPDETEDIEVHDDTWVTFPAEPSEEENDDLAWLDIAGNIVVELRKFGMWTSPLGGDLLETIEGHRESRQIRRDRYDEEGPGDPEPEYSRDDYPRRASVETFSVEAFFKDL